MRKSRRLHLEEQTSYVYDDFGNITIECRESRGFVNCRYRTYDQFGNPTATGASRSMLQAGEKPARYSTFTYLDMDEKGEWTKRIEYASHDPFTPVKITIRTKEKAALPYRSPYN
ncbi:MAG: hypothetical protein AAFY48_11565 [Bacteroidota bacterium]